MSEYAPDLTILVPVAMPLPRAELGEGPVWDPGTRSLYWVDIPARLVHRLDAAGRHTCWDVGLPAGSVAVRASGGLVVAAGTRFLALDTATGIITDLADTGGHPRTRMNDGACDVAGRFYAGTMAADESPGQGSFYRLDPDHSVTELFTGLGISNGVGWSPDDRLMFYVDSLDYRVDVMDYDPATGAMGERRPFVRLGSGEVVPDGLAVDADGGVWVAVWGGSVIQRYNADGHLTSLVRLPAANVTSLAFGGPDLDQLYITTADGPGQEAGALFTCPAGIAGLPAYPYRG